MNTAKMPASRVFRWFATGGGVLGTAALLLLVAGPLGWRAGWWHYRVAFVTLMPYAAYCGAAAVAVSVVALGGIRMIGRHAAALAIVGVLIGGTAAYFPWQAGEMRGKYPRLNDVTTDFQHPPSLAFAAAMRKAEEGNPVAYAGADPMTVQQKSYPDIEPALLDLTPVQAFGRVLAVVTAKGWTIVKADPLTGVVEACDRSRWFGFADDIAIRVGTHGEGSRIDIRSAARQGRGDFGVNATRVRGFLAALKEGS